MTVKPEPLPMAAAQKFWQDKVLLGPAQFAKLDDAAKVKAFAVSGIAKGDELTSVFNALQRAIDDGISFDDFRKDCQTIFEKRGWTGHAAWRVDNIFRTNIQTAYNVGRYEEMQRVKKTRPFWQYSAVNDSRTRPTHSAMNGKIYPADHPFWDTWYPPNGFRCRCGVVTLSQREIDRDGLTVEEKDLTGGLVEPVDPETGSPMPARYLLPDPGFDHNPGKAAWSGVVDAAADQNRANWEMLPDLKDPASYGRPSLSDIDLEKLPRQPEPLLPIGLTDDEYRAEFIRRYGDEKVIRDAAGDPAIVSLRMFMADKDQPESWKFKKAGHGQVIPLIEDMLANPYEIWLTPQKSDDGRIRLSRRYISIWKADDESSGGLTVMESQGGVWLGVTAFSPLKNKKPDLTYADRMRRGLLLWKRK